MKKINNNKASLFVLFEKEFLKKHKNIKLIAYELSINIGTIKRWILKKEVPMNYFNSLNKMIGNKYYLELNEIDYYKNNDQFFTDPKESKVLIDDALHFIKSNFQLDLMKYTLIEPSAGNGSFFLNFPDNYKKIGLDIEPRNNHITKCDWFDYIPPTNKNIVIGNPPFGLRGQLALRFMNHAAKFSDFICFILPPLFNSNGKGSPMLRIDKEFYLAKEISVRKNFSYPNGESIKVNSIFQIWTKILSTNVKPILPPSKISEWIKVYSLSDGNTSSSKRNVKMIDKCDFYLPSTTFKKIILSRKFKTLPHKRGYGIVILKDNQRVSKIFESINWNSVAFKSTNSANNLRSQIIIDNVERGLNEK